MRIVKSISLLVGLVLCLGTVAAFAKPLDNPCNGLLGNWTGKLIYNGKEHPAVKMFIEKLGPEKTVNGYKEYTLVGNINTIPLLPTITKCVLEKDNKTIKQVNLDAMEGGVFLYSYDVHNDHISIQGGNWGGYQFVSGIFKKSHV